MDSSHTEPINNLTICIGKPCPILLNLTDGDVVADLWSPRSDSYVLHRYLITDIKPCLQNDHQQSNLQSRQTRMMSHLYIVYL